MEIATKELIRVAASLIKKIPCIITSGDPTGRETSVLGEGGHDFLAKPFSLDALYNSIEGNGTPKSCV
jgi:FixJ family two-component response regulator